MNRRAPTSWADRFQRWLVLRFVWGQGVRPRPDRPLPEEPRASVAGRRLLLAAGAVLGLLLPVVVAVVLIPLRGTVATSTIALMLVIPVVVVTVIAGATSGVVASISAALAFDVLHTRPYNSFTIHATEDVEVALALAATALIVAAVVSNQLDARTRSALRRTALDELQSVARLAASADADAVTTTATTAIASVLHLQSCRWAPGYHGTAGTVLARDGTIGGAHGDLAILPRDVELPVTYDDRELGRLILRGTPGQIVSREERTVAVALADLLASRLGAMQR